MDQGKKIDLASLTDEQLSDIEHAEEALRRLAGGAYSTDGEVGRIRDIRRARAVAALAHPRLVRVLGSLASPQVASADSPVVAMLLDLAVAAQFACDDSEECEGDDGEQVFSMPASAFNRLSEALDKLEELPDDRPGSTMWPAAKARWALRNGAAPAPVAPTPAQPSDDARDAPRYRKLRAWYMREGKRMEIDPYGHIRVTTQAIFDAGVDALPSEPEGI